MQADRAAGPSARLDKGRTADRKQILLVQRLLVTCGLFVLALFKLERVVAGVSRAAGR